MLDLLKTLCSLPGPSGNEGPVRDYILETVRPYADAIVDPIGNVIVEKKGRKHSGKTILLAAHMDEVGFIITGITDEGYLKFAPLGSIDQRVVLGKGVRIGPAGIPGVIGLKPVHLSTQDERSKMPEIESLHLDIGASDAETAKKLVSLGDTACFDTQPFHMGECLVSKAIDDRVGCAVLLTLLSEDLPVDVHFAFTVQEEIGLRGATTAGFRIQPDIALILEGTTAADIPGAAPGKEICRMGGGVVIPFMDKGTVYDRTLYRRITALAERLDIPWQTKQVIAGGTDGAAIQRAGTGAQVAGLAAPVRNLHTGVNVASLQDMDHLLNLTRAVLADFGETPL